MAIESTRLRAWVYEALTRPRQELGAQPNGALQVSNISDWVKGKAQQDNFLPRDTPFSSSNLASVDQDAVRECIWSLIIQGIVVPGISNDSS